MMRKILEKIAKQIYVILKKSPFSFMCFPRWVQCDMVVLEMDEADYYVQKIIFLCEILLIGLLIMLLYLGYWKFEQKGYVGLLERPEAYEDSKEIKLKAGKQEDVFLLEIEPVQFTKEEADRQIELLSEELLTSILGANESLEQIEKDLLLPDYVEGYPFELSWTSEDEGIIDNMGTVNRKGLQEDRLVELCVTFYYKEWMWEERFAVVVLKEILSQEEQYTRELEQLLKEAEQLTRESKVWELPESFGEEKLYYQKEHENNTLLWLFVLIIGAAVAVWIGKDQDIRNRRSGRRELFQKEYVAFVESLSLYISAGINLQMALQFCARDYVKRKEEDNVLRIALVQYQKDIKNGVGFWEAIQRLVITADDVEYRKLAGLLNQGMLNGSQGLAILLEKEVIKVREEKRRQSKVTGERISTALLAPMMLQLGVVIALIMIPAFSGMQF